MDRAFDRPLILGNGQRTLTIASISEAGAFLLETWPARQRARKSYRTAIQACVRALAGKVEAEVARQALIEALKDVKHSPVERGARRTVREPDRLHRRAFHNPATKTLRITIHAQIFSAFDYNKSN